MPRPRFAFLLLAGLAPAACAGIPPPPDTATVPPNAFGQYEDPDIGAMNLAQYDFADASRTYGRPAEAARALAALDYMAGELSTSPRWRGVSAIAQMRMLQARVTMRETMGIDLNAPSQIVVNSLLAAGNALAAGDMQGAAGILHPPAFPPDMVQRLANMPYVQSVNVATTLAGNDVIEGFPNVGGGRGF